MARVPAPSSPLRGHRQQEKEIFSCNTPTFISMLAISIYNHVKNELKFVIVEQSILIKNDYKVIDYENL